MKRKKSSLFLLVLLALLLYLFQTGEEEEQLGPSTVVQGREAAIQLPLFQQNEAAGKLSVHFIDVGQGGSQLLISPSGKTMLIDAGDNSQEEAVVGYLQSLGIKRVDIVVGTHPDADHVGGLDKVIDRFDIGKIYMPNVQANTQTFESVLQSIKNKKLKVTTAKAGLKLSWDDEVEVRMVAPIGTYDDNNEMSAVLHVTYGDSTFLFTGDAERKSEADMLKKPDLLAADVLLVGHHGSRTSTGKTFLKAVDPKYAVIQSGEGNRYGHPTSDVIDRLEAFLPAVDRVLRNDLLGHIVFVADGSKKYGVYINAWRYSK